MRDLKRKPDSTSHPRHPIAALTILTLVAIVAGLVIISQFASRQNERAEKAEKFRLIEAVRGTHATVARDVMRLATLAAFDSAPPDIGSLDQLLLLNFNGADSISVLAGKIAERSDLDRSILEFTRGLSVGAETSASGMISSGDLFDVVASVIPSGSPADQAVPRIIVGLRQVDPGYIDQIAVAANVKNLELVHGARRGMVKRGAWTSGDWRGFGLIWEPSRPGNQLVLHWTAIVVAVTSIAAVALVMRARREFGMLHASEARAIEASGNDWLSGLPNRVVFNHVLELDLKALRQDQSKLGLFYLDIDRFKDINDTYGLEAGDDMILAVTRRLEAVLIQGQSLARFEGDAFSILLPDIDGGAQCETFARTIQAAMKAPFDIAGAAVTLSLSIGIAIAPDDAIERTELVRLAHMALYRAKRDGRDRIVFYKPDLNEEWRRRTLVEHQLRKAIEDGGLELRYQPIIDCDTGRVVCAEALVRWNHPAEGLIAPDRFIEFAEDRGLILPLGEWVLREACTAALNWPDIYIAVNVSPIQLREKDFADMVMRIVEETGVDPSRLELELTEGVLVEHETDDFAGMAALRKRGIRLAIDDFGTGFSSLIYLRRFAIDKIKIDRAFLEDLKPDGEGEILLSSMVKLGRDLGLTVTAEGIESAEQRTLLARLGCHQLQGYLIARPLREVEFTAFLQCSGERKPVLAVA